MAIKTVTNFLDQEMDVVEYTRIEHHSVDSRITMQVTVEALYDLGFSAERFEEIITHLDSWGNKTRGEAPDEEEIQRFHEVYWEGEPEMIDREEDWISDRKGGYDVTYELIEPEVKMTPDSPPCMSDAPAAESEDDIMSDGYPRTFQVPS